MAYKSSAPTSLYACIDTAITMDYFLNIDLYAQGYYFLKLQIYHEDKHTGQRVFSVPHSNHSL